MRSYRQPSNHRQFTVTTVHPTNLPSHRQGLLYEGPDVTVSRQGPNPMHSEMETTQPAADHKPACQCPICNQTSAPETVVLTLKDEGSRSDSPFEVRLKIALKILLRRLHLRCTDCRPKPPGKPQADTDSYPPETRDAKARHASNCHRDWDQ